MPASMAASEPGGSPCCGSATTPQPVAASSASRSAAPGAGFRYASGTTATRRERPSPRIGPALPRHDPSQPGQLALLVVVEQILADADRADGRDGLAEQPEQRLGEEAGTRRHRVVLVARLVGPASPALVGGGQLDAHAGAAVDADDDDPRAG